MTSSIGICLLLCLLVASSTLQAAGPFPRLLPPAEQFRLTLREDPQSTLPLGTNCGGEASLTLTCHAFTLILQNRGKHTVRISQIKCWEPAIRFDRKEPRSSTGWWFMSQPDQPARHTFDWINIRLKPGQRTEYSTRLTSDRRFSEPFLPGTYTLRAQWTLHGCTEEKRGVDRLTPLEVVRGEAHIPDMDFQEPVSVLSNELMAA
jgi:hypothetical protein